MVKWILFFLLMVAVVLAALNTEYWVVVAPELFGRSHAFLVASNGLIFADYGVFLLAGGNESCMLYELIGEEVGDGEGGTVRAIPCAFRYSDEGNRFTGWIDFRGHHRPFCGTQTNVFMQACKNW